MLLAFFYLIKNQKEKDPILLIFTMIDKNFIQLKLISVVGTDVR